MGIEHEPEYRLYELLKHWCQQPGHKVLICGDQVARYLERLPPPSPPVLPGLPNPYDMLAVGITVSPDSPPAAWRLVLHKCEVDMPTDEEGHPTYDRDGMIIATVRHTECSVIEEGSI